MDVVFYEAFEEEAEALRRHLPPDVNAEFTWQTIQERSDPEPPAPVVSIRTQSVLPMAWAGRVGAILSRSTGYDHLARYRRETRAAVPCGYLPLYCNRAVAEQAMLLWMALLRRLPLQRRQFRAFNRDGLTGRECRGRTLLVVGVGNIGTEVLEIGRGLGMDVLGVDRVARRPDVTYVERSEGLSRADIIVCCMNLTDDNVGYFNYDFLRAARKGALFVNVARGEMSPAKDLLRLLEEGILGGVGLDVYDRESTLAVALRGGGAAAQAGLQAVLELASRPDTVLTPHNAFNTAEAVERKSLHSIEQVQHVLETGVFKWPVPEQGP